MHSKFVVTGGAGFIGSHLVDALVASGHHVVVIDNLSSGSLSNLKNSAIDFHNLDVTDDPQKIAAIIEGSECVFHLAAKTSVQESLDDPQAYSKVNVIGTASILEACRLASVKKFVFSSTSAIYGNTAIFPTLESVKPDPISPYALSKLVGEKYCNLYTSVYGISTAVLRYFNVYGDRVNAKGSYRSVIPIFLEKHSNGEPLPITNDGRQTRDFIHVHDVVAANISAMQKLHPDSPVRFTVNIGSGESVSVNEIANLFNSKMVNVGFRLEPKMSLASIDRAQSILGWKPQVKLIDWLKDRIESQTQTFH